MSAKARRAPRSWLWLQGALAGGCVVALPGTGLLVAVLLCPAIAFGVFETTPGRPVARTMLVCGSMAVFSPLKLLWEHGNSIDDALGLLADVGRPILAWTACAAGWFLFEGSQLASRLALQAASRRRATLLRREEAELSAEWSLEEPGS